jgi:hypothetical protein
MVPSVRRTVRRKEVAPVASGGPGDHPVTDILLYGILTSSARVEGLVRDLDARGLRRGLDDLPWYDDVEEQDLYDQLIALRDQPLPIRVAITWLHESWNQVPRPPGGWTLETTALVSSIGQRWSMRFRIEPGYPPEAPRFARAEFVSPNGPLGAMAPDSKFDVIFAGAVVGRGVVLERFPFES